MAFRIRQGQEASERYPERGRFDGETDFGNWWCKKR